MSRRRPRTVVRLYCAGCGRNLADITRPLARHQYPLNPSWTHDGLVVSERNNVDQDDYRPWPADPNADWKAHTYTWRCICGRTLTLRHGAISAIWSDQAVKGETVRVPIGL